MNIRVLLLLCITLIVQGCVSAVVIGTAAVATKTINDPRTIGTQIDDSTLEARITNILSKDVKLKKKAHIVNTIYQGKVLLTGQAPTLKLAERAKRIVMSVDGVTKVYNEIRKGHPVSLERSSMDAWITVKIRSYLLVNSIVKSSNIKILTENGEVFLLGLVTKSEGRVAAEISSKVNGVRHVTTIFTYLH